MNWRNDEKTASCPRIHRHTCIEFDGLGPGVCPHRAASTRAARDRPRSHASRMGVAGRILSLGWTSLCLDSRPVRRPATWLCPLDSGSLALHPPRLCLGSRPLELILPARSIRAQPSADGCLSIVTPSRNLAAIAVISQPRSLFHHGNYQSGLEELSEPA